MGPIMQGIYGDQSERAAKMAQSPMGCAVPSSQSIEDCGELKRSTIAQTVVDRVKSARRKQNEGYRLERFAELADKHPEILEMLEIARECNLL